MKVNLTKATEAEQAAKQVEEKSELSIPLFLIAIENYLASEKLLVQVPEELKSFIIAYEILKGYISFRLYEYYSHSKRNDSAVKCFQQSIQIAFRGDL